MVTKAKLSVDVSANTGTFDSALKRADRTLENSRRSWDRSLKSSGRAFNLLSKEVFSFQTALGGMISGAGLLAFSRASLNAADRTKDLADRLNLTSKEVQVYTQFLNVAGVSGEQFEAAVTKINNRLAQGELPFKNTSEAMREMVRRIGEAKTQQDAFGVALAFTGEKMTGKFVGAFREGTTAVDAFARQQQKLGGIIDDDTINKAAAFNDQLDNMFTLLKANLSQGFLSAFVNDGEKLKDAFDPETAENLRDLGNALGNMVNFILKNLPAAIALVGTLGAGLAGLALHPLAGLAAAGFAAGGAVATAQNRRRRQEARMGQYGTADPSLDISQADIEARLAELQSGAGKPNNAVIGDQLKAAEQRRKVIQGIIADLDLEAQKVSAQVDLYGAKDAYVDRVLAKQKIEAKLAAEGIKLTDKQNQQIDEKLKLIQQESEALDALNEKKKLDEEADRRRQDAIEQLGFTFQSAFEDAIAGGQELSDVMKGLLQDIIKLAIRMAITQPMAANITSAFGGGGGGFGDIFGGIGNFLFGNSPKSGIGPSMPGFFDGWFADGGFLGAGKVGIAGEAGPELIFGGRAGASVVSNKDLKGMGGNVYQIDARGADDGAIRRLEASLQRLAGPGVVEARVSDAMQRNII